MKEQTGDRYVCLFCKDAASLGFVSKDWEEEFCWMIFRRNDDGTKTFIGRDGGEPEDQLLVRDWKWVLEALNEEARRK